MNAISTAVTGLGSATAQLNVAATQAANPTSDMDLVQSVVGQIEAQVAFAMDTQVIATADKMVGQLLDITA
jgi:flagellar hook protein FlgE